MVMLKTLPGLQIRRHSSMIAQMSFRRDVLQRIAVKRASMSQESVPVVAIVF
jgi:hypothetical protein